ncbi:MAG TPA: sigma 54-interacting transcriptional regulator, partial [Methylomirabilota bacterium]|nr:sigma 54-interacting transcriptional regulator [Methylomirabilota bacterium]
MAAWAELLGESPGMAAVRDNVARLLEHSADGRRLPPILIQGETGTGKTVLARAMHDASPRRPCPFVDINAGAVAETLLEDQLFGHERGAFTDAREARAGFFQEAHRGTLFLDEVGLMSPALQGKLLKAIEERTVRRLGSRRSEPVDVWVITASNANLAQAMRDGSFRADLYYRLAGVTFWLPPLRERGDDILLLAEHFLESACRVHRIPPRRLEAGARGMLRAHDWPGNVRELARVMECAAVFADGPIITEGLLRTQMGDIGPARRTGPERARLPLKEERDALERERLLEALRDNGQNLTRAAAALGMKRNTFRYRLERLGLVERLPQTAGQATGVALPTAVNTEPPATRWEPRRLGLLRLEVAAPSTTEPLPAGRAVDAAVEKVHIFGGRVEERSATGIVAVFGLDAAEDAPRRAAHTAVAVQTAVAQAHVEGRAGGVRAAIHVGRLQVGFTGADTTIDLDAKREAWKLLDDLLSQAEPGTIVASEATAPFLERRFELARLGHGDDRAPTVYRVVGPGRGRRLPAFVGRRQDLELLRAHRE